jgi:glycosyltransferase involved in cell wall biosynthesis
LKFEIVLPVFNEESTLETQVTKLDRYLNTFQEDKVQFEILIADNGSTDQTRIIAANLAVTMDRVNLIVVGQKGVGLALRKSWENSSADVVGYMDLDLATDLLHLNEVVRIFMESPVDLVNASRLLPESIVQNRKAWRNITSRGFNLILKIVFRTRVSDGMCGFKFIKTQHLNSLVSKGVTSDGWFFATQLLLVAEVSNLEIKEIPVVWTDDGNSKVKIFSLTYEYLIEIYKLKRRIRNSASESFNRR